MHPARASTIGRARSHFRTVWQPPAALNPQSKQILHFPSLLSQRVFAINLQHLPIILLFYWPIIHFFNIINTPSMIPNTNPLKIQHDSSPYPQECNQHFQAPAAQPGNARLYAKTGHWSDDQKLRYLMFIDYHEQRLRVRQGRRQWRLFRAMSTFVRTRKPNQCRSHHAKMESYFEDIAAVINYLKARIPNYCTHYTQALPELQKIALGPNCPASMGCNQEESISNNESQCRVASVIAARRARGSRTSIRLAEDEGGLDFRDKNLPKTDNSLNNIPQTNPSINPQRQPSEFCAFGSGELLHCAASNYFQLPDFGLLPFQDMQEERMSNFFEHYQHRSVNLCELNEWIECERLYLLWRNRVERLVNH